VKEAVPEPPACVGAERFVFRMDTVWDVAAGGQLLHIGGLKGHHKPVRRLAFTPGACAIADE
jgi:hypothetical protein